MSSRTAKKSTPTHNKFETKILQELKEAGHEFAHEVTKIKYTKPERVRTYTPDFQYVGPDGKAIFIETKGYFRPEHRTKMIHVKKCNPDLDIRIVFMRNQLINAKSGFDYIKWCERNDFPYAFETIPKEWL
jgi:predicted nuclease of restriction endonuclease-like RecB superfamily